MRVVVVGAGTVGLGIAWRAAQQGLDVVVTDPTPGRGASWEAAGMLAPITEVHYGEEPLLELNLESNRRYPAFVAELEEATGMATGYRPSETIVVARDRDDDVALEELVTFQRKLGLDVERLRARDCRQLEPALAPGVRGGILVRGDHQVDNRRLVAALEVAARRAGATFVAAAAVGGNGRSVTTTDGAVIEGDAVVLAAGAATGQLDGFPAGAIPPVRPVKGQAVRLRGRPGQAVATRNLRGLEVYLVPRADGEIVVGATVEERGFDTTVTAGAVHQLLRDAYELVPEVVELAFVSAGAGLRPATPDNAPAIGATTVDGLVVATGHYRNGILLTPVTADAVTELLATGHAPPLIRPFTPTRFAP